MLLYLHAQIMYLSDVQISINIPANFCSGFLYDATCGQHGLLVERIEWIGGWITWPHFELHKSLHLPIFQCLGETVANTFLGSCATSLHYIFIWIAQSFLLSWPSWWPNSITIYQTNFTSQDPVLWRRKIMLRGVWDSCESVIFLWIPNPRLLHAHGRVCEVDVSWFSFICILIILIPNIRWTW